MKKMLKNQKGFSLIELLIAVAIIAILVAIALPAMGNMRRQAATRADVATARIIAGATAAAIAAEEIDLNDYDAAGTDLELNNAADTDAEDIGNKMENPAPVPRFPGSSETFTVNITNSGAIRVFHTDPADDFDVDPRTADLETDLYPPVQ